MITLDASVWTACLDPSDVFHEESVTFMRDCENRRVAIYVPSFAIVETGCALARRQRDSAKGLAAARSLAAVPALRVVDVDSTLLTEALSGGTKNFLRGADALYAATAAQTHTPLITWDDELVKRSGAMTPTDWMALN